LEPHGVSFFGCLPACREKKKTDFRLGEGVPKNPPVDWIYPVNTRLKGVFICFYFRR